MGIMLHLCVRAFWMVGFTVSYTLMIVLWTFDGFWPACGGFFFGVIIGVAAVIVSLEQWEEQYEYQNVSEDNDYYAHEDLFYYS